MPKLIIVALFAVLILNSTVFADRIVMTNGDRLTGKIVKKEGDSITIQTESAGTIKIKWSSVAEVVSDEPLSVTIEDGKVIEAKLNAEDGILYLEKSEDEEIELEKSKLKDVRTPEAQKTFEIEQKRIKDNKFTDFWGGTFDAGFSMTAGNSDTRTVSGAFRAVRETAETKFTGYANALHIRNSTGGRHRITAAQIWYGARYDVNINKNWFGFGSGDFEYNKPQKLNLRAVLGGGAGYHAVKSDRVTLDFTGGFTHNFEDFSNGIRRNSAEMLFGEEAKLKLNNRAKLTNRLVVYPNISRFGNLRALFDASLQTDLNNWLGWHLTIGNRYNSRPVSLTEKNDFLMSTGLRFSFGKSKKK
ncbi:MAG TPA: DUF481 domain-containing protein [Pyrinomonadaceae bacterium]|nr:DUF481 domain-containing protein [Pyrinomonadaceae bacterium]